MRLWRVATRKLSCTIHREKILPGRKIKERFFNIWYLMRYGRKRDRQRVEWLVKFLESWCSPEDLNTKIKNKTYTLAVTFLWNNHFLESYNAFIEWLNYDKSIEADGDITVYFILLFAKNQLHRAKKLFELPNYALKDRYKPLWYALAILLKDEMEEEVIKMGSELKESVEEIVQKVEEYKQRYAVS